MSKKIEEQIKKDIEWIKMLDTVKHIQHLIDVCHGVSKDHGFWDNERNDAEMLCLMHSELSEALEGLRSGNPPSSKAPGFSQIEEELADCIIRIFDYAGGRRLDLARALVVKIEYNKSRPYKHGRKF